MLGPLYAIRWIFFKNRNKRLAKEILDIDVSAFVIKSRTTIFSDLYKGNFNEVENILAADRKILFYEENDENIKLDVKCRWELNRNHHLSILAFHAQKLPKHYIETLYNSEELNRILLETNAMEVAISVINTITSFKLVDGLCEDQVNCGANHIQKSLSYILNHYEKGIRFSANHYFFNLIGTLWICESIVGNKRTQKIQKEAYKELIQLLKQMIGSDGALYEGSTHYHKYVTETLLLFLVEFPSAFKGSIQKIATKMVQFCEYASQNNKILGLGDNDSGRLLPLPTYWDYSSSDIQLIQNLSVMLNVKEENSLLSAKEFGLYKLQGGSWNIAIRLETQNKSYRRVMGSHCHNDQLHFSLFYDKHPILVDRGTYSYIEMNNYRLKNQKTSSHNTIVVNDEEQNRIFNDWSYERRKNKAKVLKTNHNSFIGYFYDNSGNKILRDLKYIGENELKDEFFISEGNDKLEKINVFYHFAPSFQVVRKTKNKITLIFSKYKVIFEAFSGEIVQEHYFFSGEYGKKVRAVRLVVNYTDFENPIFTNSIKIKKRVL